MTDLYNIEFWANAPWWFWTMIGVGLVFGIARAQRMRLQKKANLANLRMAGSQEQKAYDFPVKLSKSDRYAIAQSKLKGGK